MKGGPLWLVGCVIQGAGGGDRILKARSPHAYMRAQASASVDVNVSYPPSPPPAPTCMPPAAFTFSHHTSPVSRCLQASSSVDVNVYYMDVNNVEVKEGEGGGGG